MSGPEHGAAELSPVQDTLRADASGKPRLAREARLAAFGGSGAQDALAREIAGAHLGAWLGDPAPWAQERRWSTDPPTNRRVIDFEEALKALSPDQVSAEAAELLSQVQRLHLWSALPVKYGAAAWSSSSSAMACALQWRSLHWAAGKLGLPELSAAAPMRLSSDPETEEDPTLTGGWASWAQALSLGLSPDAGVHGGLLPLAALPGDAGARWAQLLAARSLITHHRGHSGTAPALVTRALALIGPGALDWRAALLERPTYELSAAAIAESRLPLPEVVASRNRDPQSTDSWLGEWVTELRTGKHPEWKALAHYLLERPVAPEASDLDRRFRQLAALYLRAVEPTAALVPEAVASARAGEPPVLLLACAQRGLVDAAALRHAGGAGSLAHPAEFAQVVIARGLLTPEQWRELLEGLNPEVPLWGSAWQLSGDTRAWHAAMRELSPDAQWRAAVDASAHYWLDDPQSPA